MGWESKQLNQLKDYTKVGYLIGDVNKTLAYAIATWIYLTLGSHHLPQATKGRGKTGVEIKEQTEA